MLYNTTYLIPLSMRAVTFPRRFHRDKNHSISLLEAGAFGSVCFAGIVCQLKDMNFSLCKITYLVSIKQMKPRMPMECLCSCLLLWLCNNFTL